MKVQKLTIDIDAKGALTIKAEGFEGKKCMAVTDELEKKLGKIIDRQMTQEDLSNFNKSLTSQKVKS